MPHDVVKSTVSSLEHGHCLWIIPPMPRRAEDELDPKPVGRRLRLTRDALRLTQKEFASRADIETNTYGQWETGERLISPARAIELCMAHGLTLDWIYRGEPGDLPHKLATAVAALNALRATLSNEKNAKIGRAHV